MIKRRHLEKAKKAIFSRFGVVATCVFLGLTWAACAKIKGETKKPPQDRLFYDIDAIFADMHKRSHDHFVRMREDMGRVFSIHDKYFEQHGVPAKQSVSSSGFAVSEKHNDKAYQYDIYFSNYKKEDISVEVKDGVLYFSAKSETKEKDTELKSGLVYSFSLPKDVASKSPEVKREDGKISAIFTR